MDAIRSADAKALQEIDGVGDILAETIVAWGKDKEKKRELKNLLKHITIIAPPKKQTNHPLSGKRVVVTGHIEGYDRDEVKAMLRRYGALVSDSVSKQTAYLIAGERAGSKLEKATALGVEVVQGRAIKALLRERAP